MKFLIQRFAVGVAFVLLTTVAFSADKAPSSSAEKARQDVAVLKSQAPPAEKALACKRLAIYGTPEAVPALSSLLADKELSSWARIALEAIPGQASDEALRAALKNLQGQLLVGVINSIGVRRDAKAVSALTSKLKDPDPEVAAAAAIALGRIGGDSAAKALERALTKSPSESRPALALGCILCAENFLAAKKYSAATKLYEVVRKAQVPQQRQLEATRGTILARQAKGLPLLLETLRSPDKDTFDMGLQVARELSGRTVTEALAAELAKTPANRQGPLLLAIADREDEAVLPTILAAARTGSTDLRLQAIAVMLRLGKPQCVPVLFDTLAENNPELADSAKSALANWADNDVDSQLGTRLSRATGSERRLLVELAGQRHVAAALPELTKAANDSDAKIRAAGIKALGETVTATDLGLLTDLLAKAKTTGETEDVQAALESACTRITDKTTTANKLIAVFPTSPAVAKCSLLRVLGVVGDPTGLEAVRTAMLDSEPTVRDTAVRVLADWPEPIALAPLFEVFSTTTDESQRFLALRGCVRLLDGEGQSNGQKLKTFSELLARTQRSDDRKAILSGLANVADPSALKLVEPLLTEPQVQTEAELAYINIAAAIVKSAPTEAKAAATRLQTESKNESVRDRAAKILGQKR
jgi:HEAT repeat protein